MVVELSETDRKILGVMWKQRMLLFDVWGTYDGPALTTPRPKRTGVKP